MKFVDLSVDRTKPLQLSDLAIIRSNKFLSHEVPPGHPEHSGRLSAIHEHLNRHPDLKNLKVLPLVSALDADLRKVHSDSMIDSLARLKGREGNVDADTYVSELSVETALEAVGTTAEMARQIWRGEIRRGFSLVRPPGHHATPTRAMGFCLYNNVVVAAAAVLSEKPDARLAIIDFDLHHGNGTQDFFYDNPNVLFISSHRFPFYPGTGELGEIGVGRGKGTTINLPIADRLETKFFEGLYSGIVLNMLKEFRPEMILVSAGFDGHEEDPMYGFRISDEGYALLSASLIEAAEESAKGRILFCLEGGYEPQALARSVIRVLETMAVYPRKPAGLSVSGDDHPLLARFRSFHRALFPQLG